MELKQKKNLRGKIGKGGSFFCCFFKYLYCSSSVIISLLHSIFLPSSVPFVFFFCRLRKGGKPPCIVYTQVASLLCGYQYLYYLGTLRLTRVGVSLFPTGPVPCSPDYMLSLPSSVSQKNGRLTLQSWPLWGSWGVDCLEWWGWASGELSTK